MIHVRKTEFAPAILLSDGRDEERRLCAIADTGGTDFIFRERIYRHSDVLAELLSSHLEKCCYCESIVANTGEVEHFRPKKRYYWLA